MASGEFRGPPPVGNTQPVTRCGTVSVVVFAGTRCRRNARIPRSALHLPSL